MASTSTSYMEVDEGNRLERLGSSDMSFEDDFEQTIALLEMEVEEIETEVQQSLEEVSN